MLLGIFVLGYCGLETSAGEDNGIVSKLQAILVLKPQKVKLFICQKTENNFTG